jgi:hypothetical protein
MGIMGIIFHIIPIFLIVPIVFHSDDTLKTLTAASDWGRSDARNQTNWADMAS